MLRAYSRWVDSSERGVERELVTTLDLREQTGVRSTGTWLSWDGTMGMERLHS
jgi:hypothetical protein